MPSVERRRGRRAVRGGVWSRAGSAVRRTTSPCRWAFDEKAEAPTQQAGEDAVNDGGDPGRRRRSWTSRGCARLPHRSSSEAAQGSSGRGSPHQRRVTSGRGRQADLSSYWTGGLSRSSPSGAAGDRACSRDCSCCAASPTATPFRLGSDERDPRGAAPGAPRAPRRPPRRRSRLAGPAQQRRHPAPGRRPTTPP